MASTGEVWKLGHRPALDGVRGIAILLVVASHARFPGLHEGGTVGVTVFFVLSGFLITALLLEDENRGGVRFGGFYRRRALRLLPALFAMIALVSAFTVLTPWPLTNAGAVVVALLYVANWALIPGMVQNGLQHTWSLSVEEQFYLLWPPLLVAIHRFRGRRTVMSLAFGGAAASFAASIVLWADGAGARRVYYGSDTRAFALLAGCVLAVWMAGRCHGAPSARVSGVSGGVLIALAASEALPWTFQMLWLPIITAVVTVVLVGAAAQGESPGWLRWGPLVLVGQRSYGLYLWHYPVMLWSQQLDLPRGAGVVFIVTISVALTWLSWRYVEQPFLALKGRSMVTRPERQAAV